jgi:DNA-binding LacI/PurR family transcriptional regulator
MAAAREMGYEPNPLAQRLAYGVGSNVVYLFGGVLDVGLTTEKFLLIQQELNRHSLEVPIYTCGDVPQGASQAAQIKQLCRQCPRAIICATQRLDADVFGEVQAYQNSGGIVVAFGLASPLACDQVVFDREDNAYQAARHLIESGHRDIGIGLSNPSGWALYAVNVPQGSRLKGFQRALEEAGLRFEPK